QLWAEMVICWLAISWTLGIYSEKYIISFELFSRRSMLAYLYWIGITLIYLYFAHQFDLSRLYVFSCLGAFGIMLIINRFIYLIASQYFRKQEYLVKRV